MAKRWKSEKEHIRLKTQAEGELRSLLEELQSRGATMIQAQVQDGSSDYIHDYFDNAIQALKRIDLLARGIEPSERAFRKELGELRAALGYTIRDPKKEVWRN